MASIKELMDKTYAIDETKIKKMADVDIATGGALPLPEKGESVNIRVLSPPRHVTNEKLPDKEKGAFSARCVIFGKEEGVTYDFWVSSTIYKGLLAEFKKNNIPADAELKCIIGRVITIAGKEWPNAPKEMWKIDEITHKPIAPKTYGVALRLDLEAKAAPVAPQGTAPDLLSF